VFSKEREEVSVTKDPKWIFRRKTFYNPSVLPLFLATKHTSLGSSALLLYLQEPLLLQEGGACKRQDEKVSDDRRERSKTTDARHAEKRLIGTNEKAPTGELPSSLYVTRPLTSVKGLMLCAGTVCS
jgi:hypothetical protein